MQMRILVSIELIIDFELHFNISNRSIESYHWSWNNFLSCPQMQELLECIDIDFDII